MTLPTMLNGCLSTPIIYNLLQNLNWENAVVRNPVSAPHRGWEGMGGPSPVAIKSSFYMRYGDRVPVHLAMNKYGGLA